MWAGVAVSVGLIGIIGVVAYKAAEKIRSLLPDFALSATEQAKKIADGAKEAVTEVKRQSKQSSRERAGELTEEGRKELVIRKAKEAATAAGLTNGGKEKRELTSAEKAAVAAVPGAIGVIEPSGSLILK